MLSCFSQLRYFSLYCVCHYCSFVLLKNLYALLHLHRFKTYSLCMMWSFWPPVQMTSNRSWMPLLVLVTIDRWL
jgi:hypothetical protein